MGTPSSQPTQLTPFQVNASEPEQWRQLIRQELADSRVAIPGFLVSDMDSATQTVSVQIAIQERTRTPNGPQWWDLPVVQFVPPMIYRAGGFGITLPLKKGTKGLLIFCDCCFDFWWTNGTTNSPVAQNTGVASGSQQQIGMHRHEFWDCGFYPGFATKQDILDNYSMDSLQIRSDDGDTIVDVADAGVTITAEDVTVNASGSVQLTSPEVNANASSGAPLPLMNDNFFQWFVSQFFPWALAHGYSGTPIPSDSETTVLKGQ